MSNQFEYQALAEQIDEVPADAVRCPSMPINIYFKEAQSLGTWCLVDRRALVRSGLDWEKHVHALPHLIAALRHAQSMWEEDPRHPDRVYALIGEAWALCTVLVREMQRAYRRHSDLAAEVHAVREKTTDKTLDLTLGALAIIGRDNPAPLETAPFDKGLLDKAATLGKELTRILAKANSAAIAANPAKIRRDKAYTLLKKSVDEIRDHGTHLFCRNPTRQEGYESAYRRHQCRNNAFEETNSTAA